MSIWTRAAALAMVAAGTRGNESFSSLPDTTILPQGAVRVSGVVPRMGEHWANPKGWPSIDHVNLGFEAKDHGGYEVPHDDTRIDFVSPDALDTMKPDHESAKAQ